MRALAVLALAPAAYLGALVLAVFFYGMGQEGPTWSWPVVFVVSAWIFGVGLVAAGAVALAAWGYRQLTGGDA